MKNDSFLDLLDSYKIQLGKYHKIVMSEGRITDDESSSEPVMQDHKQKLQKFYKENNIDSIVEVLLSLRVNALQIAPELRKNLVYELIRNDIFRLNEDKDFKMMIKLLEKQEPQMQHAITSMISVIASTLRGVEYLT